MIIRKNHNKYCDCLDWNANFKAYTLKTMNEFNVKYHTTGVTEADENAYYLTPRRDRVTA